MKIAFGADHCGYEMKNELIKRLSDKYEILDIGAYTYDANDDYPDFARAVADALVSKKASRGIIICGSGVGASIAANKIKGVYACLCHDTYSAHQGVEHDNMNVLCLGARVIGIELAYELVTAFLKARFLKSEERLHRRLHKVKSIEQNGL